MSGGAFQSTNRVRSPALLEVSVQELRTRIPRRHAWKRCDVEEGVYAHIEHHMMVLGKRKVGDQDVRWSDGRSENVSRCA